MLMPLIQYLKCSNYGRMQTYAYAHQLAIHILFNKNYLVLQSIFNTSNSIEEFIYMFFTKSKLKPNFIKFFELLFKESYQHNSKKTVTYIYIRIEIKCSILSIREMKKMNIDDCT